MLVGLGGRETHAAIAHHDRGDAVPAAGGHFLVPGRLSVIVGVNVDEAGRHQQAGGVDFLCCIARNLADCGDQSVLYGDISGKAIFSGPVDDGPAADDQVVCWHGVAPLSKEKVPHCNL